MLEVTTVLGNIKPESLGVTLTHEHFLWDQAVYADKISGYDAQRRSLEPITLWNHGDVSFGHTSFVQNLMQNDINVIKTEVFEFEKLGGGSIMDCSGSFWRDVPAVRELALSTKVNIIMGTGSYIADTMSEEDRKRSVDDVAQEIVHEFRDGIGFCKTKPGFIGEIGLSSLDSACEMTSLRGSARAQGEIGCALNIHPVLFDRDGVPAKLGNEILDIVAESGGNVQKTVISHCDVTCEETAYHASLAARGAYVEFDQFGMFAMHSFTMSPRFYVYSDLHRVDEMKKLIDMGYIRNILISHDICCKHLLKTYGGHGYGHIIKNIVPMLKLRMGLSDEQVNTILVENPKRLLAY